LDDPESLRAVFPELRDLNISRSLFRDFTTLPNMAVFSEQLLELDLSFNFLIPETFEGLDFAGCFTNLYRFKMQGVPNSWYYVYKMATQGAFGTNLDLIQLNFCHLTTTDIDGEPLDSQEVAALFPNVRQLELGVNEITSWSSFNIFKDCPKLRVLYGYRNPFTDLFYDGGFPSLELAMLSQTGIHSWEHVRSCAYYPSLRTLNLSRTPIQEEMGSVCFFNVMCGFLPHLKILNQTETKGVNLDGEVAYWKFIMETMNKRKVKWKSVNFDDVEEEFPGFLRLKEHYDIAKPKKKKKKQKMEIVKCHFKSMDIESCTMPEQTKQLPKSCKISTLKVLCKKFFKLDPPLQRLLFLVGDGSNKRVMPDPMNEDQREISYYTTADEITISMQRESHL